MRPFASIAASAVGAGMTGAAAGLITLSALQSNMPALMAHLMKPVPDLAGRRVLLCTGETDHRTRGTAVDEAQQWRRALETEHEIPALLVDLRTDARCSARRRAQMRSLADSIPADHRREFVLGASASEQPRTEAPSPAALQAIRRGSVIRIPADPDPSPAAAAGRR